MSKHVHITRRGIDNQGEYIACECGWKEYSNRDSLDSFHVLDPKDALIEFVTILSKWVERNGAVYYQWKVEGDEEWHVRKTAQKEIPYHIREMIHPLKYEQMLLADKLKGDIDDTL